MNNFNISSSGINIEVNIYYDADYAQIIWDENFYPLSKNANNNIFFFWIMVI
jgi:hypothetical protein